MWLRPVVDVRNNAALLTYPLAPVYAASVGAIETDAGMVVFEWLVANPALAAGVRHRAIEHLMRAGMVYATATGKRIITLNTPVGVRKMAERIGFARVNKSLEVLEGEMP